MELFPVQSSTFSLFVEQQNELIVKSRTGTGKTLSFLLPLEYLMKFNQDKTSFDKTLDDLSEAQRPGQSVKAIILEPTRELATQV